MKRIYLSGAITGRHKSEYEAHFNHSENLLRHEWGVVNPVSLNHDHDKTYESYIRRDLKALLDCDAIYMLTGWEHSKGARIEFNIAVELKMKIIFE